MRRERYAVVSCHVERPLDDEVWGRFSALQRRGPAGFRIAALVRPPDARAGEDDLLWLERAREAAALGPLGHHTHWTAPDHARPTRRAPSSEGGPYGDPAARVREEGAWLRESGLRPTLFCGGGWYTDAAVAGACADLGYADCTPRASRPPYLAADEPWAALSEPARVRLPDGRVLPAVPTTHSVGDLARALRRRALPRLTHVYFHDTDLLSRRRSALLVVLLRLLARRARPADLDGVVTGMEGGVQETTWDDVAAL